MIVRNANGRSIVGESRTGRTAGFAGFVNPGKGLFFCLAGLDTTGYAGVAKAGDEDGIGSVVAFALVSSGTGARGVIIGSRSSIVKRIEYRLNRRIGDANSFFEMMKHRKAIKSPLLW